MITAAVPAAASDAAAGTGSEHCVDSWDAILRLLLSTREDLYLFKVHLSILSDTENMLIFSAIDWTQQTTYAAEYIRQRGII